MTLPLSWLPLFIVSVSVGAIGATLAPEELRFSLGVGALALMVVVVASTLFLAPTRFSASYVGRTVGLVMTCLALGTVAATGSFLLAATALVSLFLMIFYKDFLDT